MDLIIWLFVGGVLGWLASVVMKSNSRQSVVANLIVGIIGSLLGRWLIGPLVGAGTINEGDFSLPGLFVSFAGAVCLLAAVNLLRNGRVR